jgi:hypothetical protein
MLAQRIEAVLLSALDELNKSLPAGERAEKSALAVLFGKSGRLDRLRTVNFLFAADELLAADEILAANLTKNIAAEFSLTDLLLGNDDFVLPPSIRGLASLTAHRLTQHESRSR